MRRVMLSAAVVVLCATPALAQTTCTSATVPSNPSLTSPIAVQFGWDGKDTGGNVVDPATVQVRVTHDGVAKPLVALPAPASTEANGCKWYKLNGYVVAKGAHTQLVTLVSPDGEGAVPAPFAFVVVGLPPSTVIKQQATQ